MISAIRTSGNYKWWVFSTIAIGTFLSVVDHGSVLVALPSIERHFSSDLPTVQWIVIGYALAISVLILPMGRLGDIIGRKQVYVAGMIIFVVAAALAGASPNLGSLIAAKLFQGVGSAMVQSSGIAMTIGIPRYRTWQSPRYTFERRWCGRDRRACHRRLVSQCL